MPRAAVTPGFFSIRIIALNSIVGLALLTINFPNFVINDAAPLLPFPALQNFVISIVGGIRDGLDRLEGASSSVLQLLMSVAWKGLLGYFALVLVLSILRLRPRLPLYAFGGFVLGVFSVHVLAYTLIVTTLVVIGISWIYALFVGLFTFLAPYALVMAGIALALLLITRFHQKLLTLVVGVCLLGVAIAALYFGIPVVWAALTDLLSPLFEWLRPFTEILGRIAAFIATVVVFLVTLALSFLSIVIGFAIMGNLVTDQIRAAFKVRRIGLKSHALNGFALGSALALVLLACVANPITSAAVQQGWNVAVLDIGNGTGILLVKNWLYGFDPMAPFVATMPNLVLEFMQSQLRTIQAPLFDAMVFLVLIGLSGLNVTLSIVGTSSGDDQGRPVTFFPLEILLLFGYVALAILALFAQGNSEG